MIIKKAKTSAAKCNKITEKKVLEKQTNKRL